MNTIRGAAIWLLMTIAIAMSAGAASAGNWAEQVMTRPAVTVTVTEETRWRPCFLEFVQQAENSIGLGYRGGKYYPYPSPEGGMPTVGFGHKVRNKNELKELKKGITKDDAIALLKRDLDIAWQQAALVMMRDGVDINALNIEQREILIDYAFNGCLHQFKRFRVAVVGWNHYSMMNEYTRYYHTPRGAKRPLLDRNARFAQRYMAFHADEIIHKVEIVIASTTRRSITLIA